MGVKMDSKSVIIVAVVFALALIVSIFKFDTLKAQISALGARLSLTGRRSERSARPPASGSGGIRGNRFWGVVKAKTTGSGRIDDNLTAGKADLEAEDSAPKGAPKRNRSQ
jgi:hypothetical protein